MSKKSPKGFFAETYQHPYAGTYQKLYTSQNKSIKIKCNFGPFLLSLVLSQNLLSLFPLLLGKGDRPRVIRHGRQPRGKVNEFVVLGRFLLNNRIATTTWLCICRMITATLLPDMSQGRTQCLTPLAA